MELYDFFFPEQAEAGHLRSIAQSIRGRSRTARNDARRSKTARVELEDDVGFLALALLALVGSLVEKGVLKEDELKEHILRLDQLDGVEDGKLTPDVLRGAMGFARKEPDVPEEPQAPQPTKRRRR